MNGNLDLYFSGTTLLDDVFYDSATTATQYEAPTGANLLYIEAQGAGGGGGGASIYDDAGNFVQASGSGGEGGGFVAMIIYLNGSFGTQAIAVGSGGQGGSPEHNTIALSDVNTLGVSGGNTSVGNVGAGTQLLIAKGGSRGQGAYMNSGPVAQFGNADSNGPQNDVDETWNSHTITILSNVDGPAAGDGGSGETGDSCLGKNGADVGIIGVGPYGDGYSNDSDWSSGGGGGTSWTGKGGKGGNSRFDSAEVQGLPGQGYGSGGGGGGTAANTVPFAGGGGNGAGGYLRIQAYYGESL